MKYCPALPVIVCVPLLLSAAPAPKRPPMGDVTVTQVTIQQSFVIRLPSRKVATRPMQWKTKKGPKCLATGDIAGAAVITEDAIDLVMRGGQRMRAEFSSNCPALDYYSGFYMLPTEDGQMCAERDVIRTRSGGQCEIHRFRRVEPKQ